MSEEINISVCIPVYGVEKYIECCARSLFEQTMQEGIEFIFVDDCSPDNSIAILKRILEEYPQRKKQVKFLVHEKNQGLVAARKTALQVACGKYIIHCDSDDWVEPEMYDSLWRCAATTDADVVYCGFSEDFSNEQIVISSIPFYDSCEMFLKDMLSGKLHCGLWNKMFKSSIALDTGMCLPDEICLSEDYLRVAQMLLRCKSIAQCDAPYYHYRRERTGSYTDPAHYKMEYFTGTCRIIDILDQCLPEHLKDSLVYFKAITLFKAVKHALLPAAAFHALWKDDQPKMLRCEAVPVAKRIILRAAFISYRCTSQMSLLALKMGYVLKRKK